MHQLPKPTSECEIEKRFDTLAGAIAVSEWKGSVMTPAVQVLLGCYALGEITETECRVQVADAIATPRLDLCH